MTLDKEEIDKMNELIAEEHTSTFSKREVDQALRKITKILYKRGLTTHYSFKYDHINKLKIDSVISAEGFLVGKYDKTYPIYRMMMKHKMIDGYIKENSETLRVDGVSVLGQYRLANIDRNRNITFALIGIGVSILCSFIF